VRHLLELLARTWRQSSRSLRRKLDSPRNRYEMDGGTADEVAGSDRRCLVGVLFRVAVGFIELDDGLERLIVQQLPATVSG
jgi:hypothetical protein